jgi:hypothetical protein
MIAARAAPAMVNLDQTERGRRTSIARPKAPLAKPGGRAFRSPPF